MSFADRLVLALHIAFVIFTIGPVTAAIMSSPRAIRTGNIGVLRYLLLMTRAFAAASLGILVFGIILGQSQRELGKAWLVVSMTLFVVALVLLVLVMRDQRRALAALTAASQENKARENRAQQTAAAAGPATAADGEHEAAASPGEAAITAASAAAVATVERGRIASLGGVISLIWLAILVLMVWQP
jgi:mannitol-specific phosphotransferase system IIBC component